MPQMSPMSWFYLNLMTAFMLTTMTLKMLSEKSNENKTPPKMKIKHMKWMW